MSGYDPQKDPGYQRAVQLVKERGNQMVFQTEGERKDYERAVRSHPGNVYGTPIFMPSLFRQAKGGAVAVVTCGCGTENIWEISTAATYSAKPCSECGELVSYSRR